VLPGGEWDDLALDKRGKLQPAHILVEDHDASIRENDDLPAGRGGLRMPSGGDFSRNLENPPFRENIDLVVCGIEEWAEEISRHVIRATDIVPVLVSTGIVDLMAKVLQMGAYDVLLKPFQREQLIFAVGRALEHRRLK